jgi:phosphate transport system protein
MAANILIVEDEEPLTTLLRYNLEAEGYEVDAICTSLFRELLTYMMEDPRNISFCIHLMFCAKNIERIGDHATNIAETVFYMIEGQQILDKRPKGDMTTFASTIPGK